MLGKRSLKKDEQEDFIIEVLVLELLGQDPILGSVALHGLDKAVQKIYDLGYTPLEGGLELLQVRLYSALERMVTRGWVRCYEVQFSLPSVLQSKFVRTYRGKEYLGYAKESFKEIVTLEGDGT